MTDEAKQLLPSLLALPNADRLQLIHLLCDSVHSQPDATREIGPEFKSELNRRVEDIRSGKVKGIPFEEVDRRSREKYP